MLALSHFQFINDEAVCGCGLRKVRSIGGLS